MQLSPKARSSHVGRHVVVVLGLTAAAVAAAPLPSPSADTRPMDLKHRHCAILCADLDTGTPKYVYSGYWPYAAGASVGIYDGALSTHTHDYVACPCAE